MSRVPRVLSPFKSVALTLCFATAAVAGCAQRPTKHTTPPPTPDLATATAQARCGVRRSADKPLVVEWPAAERAALEARANQGLVAVRYEGCEMEVLSGCQVDGTYDFVALSRKHERVSIHNADELYARLPIGAASLEGKLKQRGELVVDMTIVGRKQSEQHVFDSDDLTGRCQAATHVLTGLTVGAFTLKAGAATEVSAGVTAMGAGAGGGVLRSGELLAADGDVESCRRSPDDAGAAGCEALLRVEAVPLAANTTAVAAPILAQPHAAPTHRSDEDLQAGQRAHRRAAAWRGVAIGSGVLSAASLGGMIGGVFVLAQYSNDTFDFDYEPTAADTRKRRQGTGLVVGSSIGVLGFGALAIGASGAARRARRVADARLSASVGPRFSGVTLSGRF